MVGLGPPRTEVVAGPHGPLEVLSRGTGEPSTLFVHGLSGSITSTRPYAGGVSGRRTFVHIAGHGASQPPPSVTYAALSREVWAAADHVRATGVLGISMGAGAVLSGLARDPSRFRAVVLVLPAALDRPRADAAMGHFHTLASLVRTGDVGAVADYLYAQEPPEVSSIPQVRCWCRERAEALVAGGPEAALRQIPGQAPLADAASLQSVSAPVLVLAQEDDAVHPVGVARDVARSLPNTQLEVFGPGGLIWAHRERVRAIVGEFVDQHGA
ncbi:MAG: alpha/beta hydrolase [Ornithinimicrobium sp.]